ncbi:hypothetical protein FOH24_15380 [Acetobacter tropicalis]|uniref:Uncharacterized protein n=1 Tax=Acetobacter tropicalis TaxID=104102 RepID=A0A094YRU3_9PROT|nr:hypothetical protein [Acetobacter tropicalis]KAA8383968.1 hypothetical protein FOH22_15595 [Acetobacter tropicalis]KAA8386114.1 hypothetical protein FOH24_15380 [Acetobacter tropicalis]KGB24745.1 hypothetical protein AtDm6_1058 [Acetobacter tropicalis]MBC9007457.1 hypothetical protein [Acetobacter tropicalis]MDO8171645.1 hypothetical protein [Acetobacter tropicalis]
MSHALSHSPGLSRRGALASVLAATAAALPVMASAATPSSEDATLLALCAEFWQLQNHIKTLDEAPAYTFGSPHQKRHEAALEEACRREWEAMEQLVDTPAASQRSQQAKASILLAILPSAFDAFDLTFESNEIQLVMSLLQDVAGEAKL